MLMLLGTFLAVVGLTYGAVVLWLMLLNRRDRREAALLGTVLKPFTSPTLRGRVAVRARSALLASRHVVTIDMRGCSREEIWEAVARLSRCLPPRVRLAVDGTVDGQSPTRLIVEAETAHPLRHPCRPSVASGGRVASLPLPDPRRRPASGGWRRDARCPRRAGGAPGAFLRCRRHRLLGDRRPPL